MSKSTTFIIIGVIVVVAVVAAIFMFKGSGPGKGSSGGRKTSGNLPMAQINCANIPNKEPNMSGPQTAPFFRCGSKDGMECYNVGVSPSQKDGWYDMTQVGEDCTNVPLCRDVATKCGLAGLASL